MARIDAFNPDAVQDEERELLPPGAYTAQVIESDLVPTKNGAGQMLKLTFEIVEGPCARRKLWENLNIINPNAQAQEIAHRALKRICVAVGHQGVLTDSEALHFKPVRLRVSVEEDKSGQYGPQNRVKAYESVSGSPSGFSQASTQRQQAQPQQQAAAGGGARPWNR